MLEARLKTLKKSKNKVSWMDMDTELTLLSRATRILLVTNILPVSLHSGINSPKFFFFSIKTFKYILFAYTPFVVIPLLIFLPSPDFFSAYVSLYDEVYSGFDRVWFVMFNVGTNCLAPLITLTVAKAFCPLSDVSLSRGLEMFDTNFMFHIGLIVTLNCIGYSAISIGHYLAMEPSLTQFGTYHNYALAAGYVVMSLYSIGFLLTVPTILALSWIYNIKKQLQFDGRICKVLSPHLINFVSLPGTQKTVSWARSCIDLYNRVENHLGLFLFCMFSLVQFMWIEALFLAMSLPIKSTTDFLPMLLQTIGGKIKKKIFFAFNFIRVSDPFNLISHIF